MADIHLSDMRNLPRPADVDVIYTVPEVNIQIQVERSESALPKRFKFLAPAFRLIETVGESPGVQLNRIGPDLGRDLDLLGIRVQKKADFNPTLLESRNHLINGLPIGFDVETHDWPDNEERKGRIGQFGWYTLKDEETLRKGHIVQIG